MIMGMALDMTVFFKKSESGVETSKDEKMQTNATVPASGRTPSKPHRRSRGRGCPLQHPNPQSKRFQGDNLELVGTQPFPGKHRGEKGTPSYIVGGKGHIRVESEGGGQTNIAYVGHTITLRDRHSNASFKTEGPGLADHLIGRFDTVGAASHGLMVYRVLISADANESMSLKIYPVHLRHTAPTPQLSHEGGPPPAGAEKDLRTSPSAGAESCGGLRHEPNRIPSRQREGRSKERIKNNLFLFIFLLPFEF